jgi:hypothetical protein
MLFDPLVLSSGTIHDEKVMDYDNEDDHKNDKNVHFEPGMYTL